MSWAERLMKLFSSPSTSSGTWVAIAATSVFAMFPEAYSEEARRLMRCGDEPLEFPGRQARRISGTDQRAHAGADDAVDRDAVLKDLIERAMA